MRKGLIVAVLLCLAGAALLLLAAARVWVEVRTDPLSPVLARTTTLTGDELVPGLRALALLGLAAVAAVVATRSWGRVAVGVLVAAAGAWSVVLVARFLAEQDEAALRAVPGATLSLVLRESGGAWPYVGLAGGLLLAAAGLLVAVRGRTWTAMGARYEAPAAPKPAGEASLWEALDRGEDPTH